VLSIDIPAPAAWILPFEGATNAATDRMIEKPFPMRLIMNTTRTMVDPKSMKDLVDLPIPGTLVKAGSVMFRAAISVESDTFLVRFAISGASLVRFMKL
jgi:hypothetical protein